MKEKDSLVERYEVEIRRRNDEIERKQSEVDRLNKKLDQLQSNMKEENMGPLEATIHNLTNEIAKKTKENSELQYYWLRSQTELVNLTKSMEKESVFYHSIQLFTSIRKIFSRQKDNCLC